MPLMKIAIDIAPVGRNKEGLNRTRTGMQDFWALHAGTVLHELERLGHEAELFRREDDGASLQQECQAINSYGANAVVSLKMDALDAGGRNQGNEVIYFAGSKYGRLLAQTINRNLSALDYTREKSVKSSYRHKGNKFLAHCNPPSVIISGVLPGNAHDERQMEKQGCDIARSIALAVHHFGDAMKKPLLE